MFFGVLTLLSYNFYHNVKMYIFYSFIIIKQLENTQDHYSNLTPTS